MTFDEWWNNGKFQDFTMYWHAVPKDNTNIFTRIMQEACRDAWIAGQQELRKHLASQLKEDSKLDAGVACTE